MAKLTIGFGILLIALGAWGFFGTGGQHPTALIPGYFGLAMVICGVLANSPNDKKRMLWMHIAVTIGLVGLIAAGSRAGMVLARSHGDLTHEASVAVTDQIVMSVICLVYVALCVRSFITARRGRKLEA
jgi:hypothetical protein